MSKPFGQGYCVLCSSTVDIMQHSTITCGHSFHDECLEFWSKVVFLFLNYYIYYYFQKHDKCPVCRRDKLQLIKKYPVESSVFCPLPKSSEGNSRELVSSGVTFEELKSQILTEFEEIWNQNNIADMEPRE